MKEASRTHVAVGAIIPMLDKEPSLPAATRSALIDLVSAYERDKYELLIDAPDKEIKITDDFGNDWYFEAKGSHE